MIVRGRSHVTQITARPGSFRSDWRTIYEAIDQPSDAAFFEDFKGMLRRLVTDRALLQRISAHNLAVPTPHEMQQVDIDQFRAVIKDGINRAREMAASRLP
jgi:hypothetical protein